MLNASRAIVQLYPFTLLVPCLLLMNGLTGCTDSQQAVTAANAPPPSVIAMQAEIKPVEERHRFVGRVVAVDRVELRARVEGFLNEQRFVEGQQVEAGDVLFIIEPEQYEALVNQRKADLASAVANEKNTRAQLRRGEELLKTKAIPESEVDKLRANEAIAKADIAQAKAALNAAELELNYTQIKSPISGRIGLVKYTEGNLVRPLSGTLATIVSGDPVYVQFPLTQRELLMARRNIREKGGDASTIVVKAELPDESLYEHEGHLNFVDVTTNPGTDTVTLRAEFPNPDGTLVDGQYVGVIVLSGEPMSEILIPRSSLQVDQQGVFIMIVDADKKAQVRRVTTGTVMGSNVAVTHGLKEGELVITQGIQKVRPGQVVATSPEQMPLNAP